MEDKPVITRIPRNKNKTKKYSFMRQKKAVIILIIAAIILGMIVTYFFYLNSASYKSVAKVNNINISQGYYRYSLMLEKKSILSNYKGFDEKDIWQYRESEVSLYYSDEVEDWVMSQLIRDEVIRYQFKELGLEFTESQNKLRKTNMESEERTYNGKNEMESTLKTQNIKYNDVLAKYEAYDRFELVFLYYFGENGVYGVSREDIDAYYAKQNARIKSVFIPLTDDQGEALSEKEQKKNRELAEKVLQLASDNSGEDKFDSLIQTYNKDTSMANYPNGYIITQNYSAVPEYKEAAFAMNVDDIKMIETDSGFYILKKYSAIDSSVYSDVLRRQALFAMKGDAFEMLVEQWKKKCRITYNQSVIDQISIEDIKVIENNN